jgi:hypothetical protein
MSDPTPLLVPMAVQALLVNRLVQQDPDHQLIRWLPNYQALDSFEDPVPTAWSNLQGDIALGVHLHWRLPAALTRARGKSTEKAELLLAPNRWIVARLATAPRDGNAPPAPPQLTAWIVESDFTDPDEGTSPFLDLSSSTSGSVKLTKLGRNMAIEQWEGEPGRPMFLQPTGLADVTFTAFQPGIVDVFAFRDDTTGLAEGTLLTYLVAGWYSDPTKDPLQQADPLAPAQTPPALLTPKALEWNVLGDAGSAPTLCVVHGMIHGLSWQTASIPPRIDADATQMQVAVGYTAVDALAAILAAKAGQPSGGELETKLQAFQYDTLSTLDDPDGTAQLELRIRQAWFGSTPGGTRWSLVPVAQGAQRAQEGDALDRTATPPPRPLTEAQEQWLAALNTTQRSLDTARRELKTMQWELFALWWKSQRAPHDASDQRENFGVDLTVIMGWIADALDDTKDQSRVKAVQRQQDRVNALAATLPDPTSPASIDAWSKTIPAAPPPPGTTPVALALKPNALPSFFHPADPVVLIAGLTPPTNDVDDSVPLSCRTLDAVVTGVNVGSTPVTAASGSLGTTIPRPDTAKLPPPVAAAVNALAVETFFADPTNAASIVTNGLGSTDEDTIGKLATAMAAGTAQIATITPPLPASFAYVAWQQAWSPLFLQWTITWFPTVTVQASGPIEPPGAGRDGAQDNWPFTPDPWHFDGSDCVIARGSEYHAWTGGEIWGGLDQVGPKTYIGRTFLTPHANLLLIRRLADYVRLHPEDTDLEKIEDLIDAVGESRFLSQSLSGFNSAFIMRGLTHSPAPDPSSPVGSAVAGENRGVPMVDVGNDGFGFGQGGTPFFFPARGGFFQFERLIIVDSFGQKLNLLSANGNGVSGPPESFVPIRGAGLVPDASSGIATPERRIKQAPRIVQPSRLDLRLLDASDDTKELFYAPGVNPVCGWLLPNHLDHSIAVYDAAGNALGELLVLADATGRKVDWLAAPDVANPITGPAQIANPHLRAALSALMSTSGGTDADRAAAFDALYQSIDETLWMIDPPGGQSDHDLAVLIGRPLAVVRAQIQFELFGKPATNQSWRDTLQDLDGGLTELSFPIRLGSIELLDDGLIGYFTGDGYDTFHAVHPSTTATSPYVAAIAPDHYFAMPLDYPSYTTQNLTLLLDPHGTVHATTGILPTATLRLPAPLYTTALARMAMTFRIGPVLTQPDSIRLPYPGERHGTWTWIRRTGPGATDWEIDSIVPANAQARLADTPPHLIDGWLQFTPRTDS